MKTLKKVILMVAIFLAVLIISNVSNAATVKVTGETLNVRKEASTSSDVIAMLSKDIECELLGEEGDFYKIKYKNYVGYVSKKYAEVIGKNGDNTLVEGNTNEQNTINNENVSNSENIDNTQSSSVEQENTIDNNQNSSNTVESNSNNENINNEATESYTGTEKTLPKNTDIRILPLIYSSVLENSKQDISVLVITEINGWSYIQTDEINGWVRTDRLNGKSTSSKNEQTDNKKDDETTENKDNNSQTTTKTGYISEEYVNVRSGPSTEDKVIKILVLNSEVTIIGEEGSWYKVKSGEDQGYISKEFVSDKKRETVSRSSEARTTKNETSNKNIEDSKKENSNNNKNNNNNNKTNISNVSSKGEDVVAYAKQYLGCPYVYGAAGSKSFDCSGFTMYVYKHFGISLPHGATSQSRYGTKVSKSNLRAGDIVFLTDYETGVGIGHCGIYIGNGNFIHASTTGYKVRISSLNVEYAGRFYSAIRLL